MSGLEKGFLTYQEYVKGLEEFEKSQGWQISKEIEHLRTSFYVYRANLDELLKTIKHFKDQNSLLFLVQNDDREINDLLNEVTRQLHNFVAAAKTLVEHTRIIAREMYAGSEFWEEYKTEVEQRFTTNQLVQFIHKLRDYMLHRDLPVTSVRLNLAKFESSLQISIEQLRDWDGWNKFSRNYLDSANNDENIEDIVNEYSGLILSFHQWFYDRQLELHEAAFREAEELRQRIINSPWHIKI